MWPAHDATNKNAAFQPMVDVHSQEICNSNYKFSSSLNAVQANVNKSSFQRYFLIE